MNLSESLRVALRGLSSNKLRTALTMLGIIIGVGVVILVVAIGQGAAKNVTDTVNSLGTNLLLIWPGSSRLRINAVSLLTATGSGSTNTSATTTTVTSTGTATTTTGATSTAAGASGSNAFSQTNHLTLDDAKQIAANFKQTVDAVAPMVRGNVGIRYGALDSSTNVQGTTIDYPYVNNASVDRGRFFNQYEYDGSLKVCVVGTTVADKLTGDPTTDLTGKTIAINQNDYKVVGMLASKGSTSWGQDQDDVVIMPITTAMRRLFNRRYLDFMSIRCTSPQMIPLAQEQVSNLLRIRHHLLPPFPDNDDFNIRNQTEILAARQSVTNTMNALLSAVAVISLVIGGIGIMNIMLVSVTERTREIGIRKAIGATPRDIMLQFLIESSLISLIGGLIGIVLGVGGAYFMQKYLGWTTIVNPGAVVIAILVSAGVGIFFGIYPASKAAQLHPIEALRYE